MPRPESPESPESPDTHARSHLQLHCSARSSRLGGHALDSMPLLDFTEHQDWFRRKKRPTIIFQNERDSWSLYLYRPLHACYACFNWLHTDVHIAIFILQPFDAFNPALNPIKRSSCWSVKAANPFRFNLCQIPVSVSSTSTERAQMLYGHKIHKYTNTQIHKYINTQIQQHWQSCDWPASTQGSRSQDCRRQLSQNYRLPPTKAVKECQK